MIEDYVEIPQVGQRLHPVAPEDLTIIKAGETALALLSGEMNWVQFIECFQHLILSEKSEEIVAETVVFDAEVELPQLTVYDIKPGERVAVTFRRDDTAYPGVYALRRSFPKVPHLNLESFELPRSLCLYDKPYSDIKLRWTPIAFIERIRSWLADTATAELHKTDQPLEPLLVGADALLILPANFPKSSDLNVPTKIEMLVNEWDEGRFCFVAQENSEGASVKNRQLKNQIFTVLPIMGEPQRHGLIRQKPNNLPELHEFLTSAKIDLLAILRNALRNLSSDVVAVNSGLILLIVLPKTRGEIGSAENTDIYAFVCVNEKSENGKFPPVWEIGEQAGVWKIEDKQIGHFIKFDESKRGESIKLLMLSPCPALSRQNATLWGGTKKRNENRITAVGMGALGSQVFLNLIRVADGEWTLIDKDILLPHNFVRHAAYAASGIAKAELLALIANRTIEEPAIANAIVADVLAPSRKADELVRAYSEAQVILDFSASQAVARHLALDVEATARRISLFLNPTGFDLVMLVEDSERTIKLDSLEMQYYRLLINNAELRTHLELPGGQIRYSDACRETSNQILPENVALCAAIGSRNLRQMFEQAQAVIAIWRTDEDGQARKFSAAPARSFIFEANGWTIKTDEVLLNKIRSQRKTHLPVETGGTLIGSYDMQRKIIYVVDALPPPADSVQQQTHFIRGSYGLKPQIEVIERITLGNLQYVGEWHSHPAGYSAKPSEDDSMLLALLAAQQHKDGNPALVLIIGENDISWHVA